MMHMTRTTIDVDPHALDLARRELGTKGLSTTVNAALREVGRRRALASFDVIRDIDGTPAEVQANRQERFPEPKERVAHGSALEHRWLVPDGTLA
jgi:Arc/MetJ family transcription regulator